MGLFQAKLEARRNKRRNAEKSKLEKDALLEDEETRRRQMLQSLQDESRREAAAAAGDASLPVAGVTVGDSVTSPSQVLWPSCICRKCVTLLD